MPTWKKFSHPNIAVFRGVDTDIFPLSLIYNWEESGNIVQHLVSHPETPRLPLVPVPLTDDIIQLILLPDTAVGCRGGSEVSSLARCAARKPERSEPSSRIPVVTSDFTFYRQMFSSTTPATPG